MTDRDFTQLEQEDTTCAVNEGTTAESTGASSPSDESTTAAVAAPELVWWRRLLHRADLRNWQTLMGWPLLVTYFWLTFAQELPTTAIGLILANSLQFGPDEVPQYYAATFIPWTIRPVYAFVSDQVPIFAYRRRPWFVISAVCGCITQVCLALFGHSKESWIVLAVATQVFIAFSEVVCDSMSVEWGNDLAARLVKYKKETPTVPETEQSNGESGSSPGGDSAQPASRRELSTPLLEEDDNATAVSRVRAHILVAPVEAASSSSSSSPIFLSSPSESVADGLFTGSNHHRGYASLREEGAPDANATEPSQATPDPVMTSRGAAERLSKHVLEHILRTTDASKLTSVVIKSRIQSECMSVRTTGSVMAAATSIVMMLYWQPRTVVFWGSISFLLGLCSIVWYVQEKKIKNGFFFLAEAPDTEIASKPIQVAGITLVPTAEEIVGGGKPTTTTPHDHDEEKADSLLGTGGESIALQSLRSHDDAIDQSMDTPLAEGSSSPKASSDSQGEWLGGMPMSKWVFLYRKLLALMNALILLAKPLTFILLINMMPDSGDAFYNYLYSDYSQFVDWQYGLFSFIGLSGSLLGCLFYQSVIATSTRSMKLIFVFTSLGASIVGCLPIFLATKTNSWVGLDDQWFIILSSFVVSAVSMLAVIPPIILASHYSPKGIGLEGSMFSLFAATAHIGSLVSAEWSSKLTRQLGITQKNWSNLAWLIIICNILGLVPLVTIPYLLKDQPVSEEDEAAKSDKKKGASHRLDATPMANPTPLPLA